jgi:hypothetical protein
MARPWSSWRWASSFFLLMTCANICTRTSPAQSQEKQLDLTPAEVKLYQQASTLIGWVPAEVRVRPELRNLRPEESQRDLPMILRKVGEGVAGFFVNFPNTTCTESVQSQICSAWTRHCKMIFKDDFRYLLLVHSMQGARALDEYRTDAQGNTIDYRRLTEPPVLTYQFTAATLYFHPRFQKASLFRYFGRQALDGQETEVVGFAQIPENSPPVTWFQNGDKTARLLVQGLVWIDPASSEIVRIQTDLLAPRPDVGLIREHSVIDFSAVHLSETSATYFLPTKIAVDIKVSGQHYRNTHVYSDFKLFRVESHIGPAPQR